MTKELSINEKQRRCLLCFDYHVSRDMISSPFCVVGRHSFRQRGSHRLLIGKNTNRTHLLLNANVCGEILLRIFVGQQFCVFYHFLKADSFRFMIREKVVAGAFTVFFFHLRLSIKILIIIVILLFNCFYSVLGGIVAFCFPCQN